MVAKGGRRELSLQGRDDGMGRMGRGQNRGMAAQQQKQGQAGAHRHQQGSKSDEVRCVERVALNRGDQNAPLHWHQSAYCGLRQQMDYRGIFDYR